MNTGWTMLAVVVTLGACFVVLCRIDKMLAGVTRTEVFIQHASLGLGLFCAAIFEVIGFGGVALASASSGVVAFLGMSTHRWKHQAPEGTTRPGELDQGSLNRIYGGKKPCDCSDLH